MSPGQVAETSLSINSSVPRGAGWAEVPGSGRPQEVTDRGQRQAMRSRKPSPPIAVGQGWKQTNGGGRRGQAQCQVHAVGPLQVPLGWNLLCWEGGVEGLPVQKQLPPRALPRAQGRRPGWERGLGAPSPGAAGTREQGARRAGQGRGPGSGPPARALQEPEGPTSPALSGRLCPAGTGAPPPGELAPHPARQASQNPAGVRPPSVLVNKLRTRKQTQKQEQSSSLDQKGKAGAVKPPLRPETSCSLGSGFPGGQNKREVAPGRTSDQEDSR